MVSALLQGSRRGNPCRQGTCAVDSESSKQGPETNGIDDIKLFCAHSLQSRQQVVSIEYLSARGILKFFKAITRGFDTPGSRNISRG